MSNVAIFFVSMQRTLHEAYGAIDYDFCLVSDVLLKQSYKTRR